MRLGTLMLLVSLLVLETAQAQKWHFPDSPTGHALTALVTMLDSGDEADIASFIETHLDDQFIKEFSKQDLIATFAETHAEVHPFDVVGVNKTGEWSAECILQALESDQRLRISFSLEAQPPHRFNSLDIQPVSGEPITFQTPDELDQYLQQRASDGTFSGVVLISRHGAVQFHKAYGLASKRFGIANRIDTRFNIGSINKMFTGVAVLQLAEQGKLTLDDPISTYLPDFPKAVADKVTIRHLLQHRSGWGSYWDDEHYRNNWPRLRSVSDYMAFIKDIPLDFEPGTSQAYSNTGYEVLGALIEAASGQDYYAYMRAHVYAPAGMTGTDSYVMDEVVENLAIGYMRQGKDEGFPRENTYHHSVKGTPAGGGYSTAEDLLRFDQALQHNELLSEAYTRLFLDRFKDGAADGPLHGAIGYGGGGPGINAVVEVDFDNGYTVIVLSNYDPPTASELGGPIMRMVEQSGS